MIGAFVTTFVVILVVSNLVFDCGTASRTCSYSTHVDMRILHVVPTYHPAVRYGGPIYSVHSLCRALAADGHRVHVFTTNVDGPGNSDVPLRRPVDLDGVQVHYFPSRWFRRIYCSVGLA